MKAIPIVITEPEYVKAREIFDELTDMSVTVTGPSETEVVEGITRTGASAAVLGVERYPDALYGALPAGGVISRFGVGHDGIDKAKATASRLYVTNTPGVLEEAVAEHALALMLAVTKQIPRFVKSMASDEWAPVQTRELRGKTLAVLGCGAIGRRVARIASVGFGMRVIGYDVDLSCRDELVSEWGFSAVTGDLSSALAEGDYVSLHIPAMEATHHFVDSVFLAQCRRGAVLINTARGSVVDEIALHGALAGGQLSAAALDVFEAEPYVPRDSEADLRRLPNVLLTPHVSSGTVEACARVAHASLDNIRNARAGAFDAVSLINRDILEISPE